MLSHYVLWNASPALADLLGLAKGKDSKYRHKVITLKLPEPRHPIMHGLPDTFTIADECFWNLQGDRSKVTALATSDEIVGDQVSAEPVIWAYERGKGRVVASTLGHFDWTFHDQVVAAAKRHGIAVYGLLAYWSDWTRPYTPDGIADYCRYVRAVVEHYKVDVHHWEIYNEPNIFFWQGPREMYAELLKQAYATVKAADPTALVLGCSTAGIDTRFIEQTLALGAPFDVLTIHPYRPVLDDTAFARELRDVQRLVAPRPVWIAEMGWATQTEHNALRADFAPNSERRQAELLARTYLGALVSGAVANVSWYDFRNDGDDPFDFEANLGVVTRGRSDQDRRAIGPCAGAESL